VASGLKATAETTSGARILNTTPRPDQGQSDVYDGELLDGQLQHARTDVHRKRGQDIAAPHEEGVDRLLRFIFLFTARGEPQELAGGIHDRVVSRVLRRLDPADDRQADASGDDGVAQGHRRSTRHRQTAIFHQLSDEGLQQKAVDPELQSPLKDPM
jgi:hypothetical protein